MASSAVWSASFSRKYGIASLEPPLKLIGAFYIPSIFFVVVVLGAIALLAGFNIFKFLLYIKEEMILVLAISSSEPVLPTLMEKLEALGCSKALVGLVVPTGYTFNTDGNSYATPNAQGRPVHGRP
jgi:aerobic C4-dicarboxylate transport protein